MPHPTLAEHSPREPQDLSEDTARRVLLVVGAGRSGTSTLALLMRCLGMHVPQPEVPADESNPRGFAEPQWLVEFHDQMLAQANVAVSDARPHAWSDTAEAAMSSHNLASAQHWLQGQLREGDLVLKDPRLSWFIGLWVRKTLKCQAAPAFVTMLRSPAEVVGSKQKYYANTLGGAHLAAGWVNMLLHTERATRTDGPRAMVRYEDLLTDAERTVLETAERLDLQRVLGADQARRHEAWSLVDPALRRVSTTLADLELPSRLHEIVEETWLELNRIVDPAEDTPAARERFDALHDAYRDLYLESEAIARSSAVATGRRQWLAGRAELRDELGQQSSRRRADVVPHEVRAAVPPKVRSGLRKAFGRER